MSVSGKSLRASLLAAAAAGAALGSAAAQQNEAGEVIGNTFTLDYSVGGVAQTGITNDDEGTPAGYNVQGSVTKFTVDRKVDLDVSSRGDAANLAPGQVDAELFFVVTNEGNDNFQYQLSASNRPDGSSNDEFDVSGIEIAAVGVASAAACSASVDFSAGALDGDGSNNADVAAGGFLCVRVRSDVPGTSVNGDDAGLFLSATAVQPSAWANTNVGALPGTAPTAGASLTVAGNNQIEGAAQNVFVDAAGVLTGDIAADAAHSDLGTLIVSSAALSAQKNVFAVATDGTGCALAVAPVSQPTGQYAVPGACIVYTIEVQNSGGAIATDVAISDLMPAGVTFAGIAATGFVGGTLSPAATATTCTVDGAGRCPVSLSGSTLPNGVTGIITIRALVD